MSAKTPMEHKPTDECSYDRNGSHSAGHYVCACGWEDSSDAYGMQAAAAPIEQAPLELAKELKDFVDDIRGDVTGCGTREQYHSIAMTHSGWLSRCAMLDAVIVRLHGQRQNAAPLEPLAKSASPR
jgi:hypothetical protein